MTSPCPPDSGGHWGLIKQERQSRWAVPVNAETLGRQDCVLLVTDHDAFDYDAIARHARLLVDTRGRYPRPSPNIVKA